MPGTCFPRGQQQAALFCTRRACGSAAPESCFRPLGSEESVRSPSEGAPIWGDLWKPSFHESMVYVWCSIMGDIGDKAMCSPYFPSCRPDDPSAFRHMPLDARLAIRRLPLGQTLQSCGLISLRAPPVTDVSTSPCAGPQCAQLRAVTEFCCPPTSEKLRPALCLLGFTHHLTGAQQPVSSHPEAIVMPSKYKSGLHLVSVLIPILSSCSFLEPFASWNHVLIFSLFLMFYKNEPT